MASSWRTVMGMEERAFASSSVAWTCLRIETKWDESFSAAASLRRGAQRLGGIISVVYHGQAYAEGLDLRLAVRQVALHCVHGNLRLGLLLRRHAALVNSHNVLCDALVATTLMRILDNEDHVETG